MTMARHVAAAPRLGAARQLAEQKDADASVRKAREVQAAFNDFVGQTFFGQMIKAMRSSVGRPAYFHGGRAEEMFRSQLDQTMAEQMADQSAAKVAGPMFRNQFPHLAELLDQHASAGLNDESLADLDKLRRS